MKTCKKLISLLFLASSFCCVSVAAAQEACNTETQEALDTCIADARESCEASIPECEPTTITPESALALVQDRCGLCDEAKNFGKFNSCLKKVRNGIRRLGALTEEIRDTLGTARAECKAEKKGGKNYDNSEEEEENEDD